MLSAAFRHQRVNPRVLCAHVVVPDESPNAKFDAQEHRNTLSPLNKIQHDLKTEADNFKFHVISLKNAVATSDRLPKTRCPVPLYLVF